MRRFWLARVRDISGVSGIGIVAEGVEFSNGRVVLVWLKGGRAMGVYDSMDQLIEIHGHEGATRVEWIDEREIT